MLWRREIPAETTSKVWRHRGPYYLRHRKKNAIHLRRLTVWLTGFKPFPINSPFIKRLEINWINRLRFYGRRRNFEFTRTPMATGSLHGPNGGDLIVFILDERTWCSHMGLPINYLVKVQNLFWIRGKRSERKPSSRILQNCSMLPIKFLPLDENYSAVDYDYCEDSLPYKSLVEARAFPALYVTLTSICTFIYAIL